MNLLFHFDYEKQIMIPNFDLFPSSKFPISLYYLSPPLIKIMLKCFLYSYGLFLILSETRWAKVYKQNQCEQYSSPNLRTKLNQIYWKFRFLIIIFTNYMNMYLYQRSRMIHDRKLYYYRSQENWDCSISLLLVL